MYPTKATLLTQHTRREQPPPQQQLGCVPKAKRCCRSRRKNDQENDESEVSNPVLWLVEICHPQYALLFSRRNLARRDEE